jgi:glycosyltransferase involved in cell wall biosynthesis
VIYFCIPAHNEERTVGVLLWKIRRVMEEFPRDYQLLVLDDGSTDRTADVLDPYTRVLPLTVLRNDTRHGYAASLERLLRTAVARSAYPRRDVVVTVQADFTDQPDGIPDLIRKVEGGADLVSGVPRLRGERVPRRVRWARRLLALLVPRNAWPESISDHSHGFRA